MEWIHGEKLSKSRKTNGFSDEWMSRYMTVNSKDERLSLVYSFDIGHHYKEEIGTETCLTWQRIGRMQKLPQQRFHSFPTVPLAEGHIFEHLSL